jgi:hypothetical protein
MADQRLARACLHPWFQASRKNWTLVIVGPKALVQVYGLNNCHKWMNDHKTAI